MTLQKNTIYHGLTLLQYCGGGAFGDVYYCKDISNKHMAIKIISKIKLGDSWKRELKGVTNYRLITENAPELLRIYQVGEDEESFFYTMEAADSLEVESYLPDTLANRLAHGAISQGDILPMIRDILDGIKVIHQSGFAHRDIKPDNILFVNGKPKIGDIGLVSAVAATVTKIAGTLDFLPPEQRSAEKFANLDRIYGQRSDFYAFGKVIYCIVTGQAANLFPTIPAEIKLSPALKFYLRLSLRLCDKEPVTRLDSLLQIEKELIEIEHKLLHGETFCDNGVQIAKSVVRCFVKNLISIIKWTNSHYLMLLIILLATASTTWYFYEPPFDITKQQNKLYQNVDKDFSMLIPFQMEVLPTSLLDELADEMQKNNDMTPEEVKYWKMFKDMATFGAEILLFDLKNPFFDNIVIQPMPLAPKEFFEIGDERVRLEIKKIFQGDLKYNTEIYDIQHSELNGKPYMMIYLSHNVKEIRTLNYIFPFDSKCISVALTANVDNFEQRRLEFESILKTIKFKK